MYASDSFPRLHLITSTIVYILQSAKEGDWGPAKDFVWENKGLILSISLPFVVFLRFPAFIPIALRSALAVANVFILGAIRTGTLNRWLHTLHANLSPISCCLM